MTRDDLAAALVQIGRDEMATALADMLATLDPSDQAEGYLDGVEDALLTLLHAGATDPR